MSRLCIGGKLGETHTHTLIVGEEIYSHRKKKLLKKTFASIAGSFWWWKRQFVKIVICNLGSAVCGAPCASDAVPKLWVQSVKKWP